MIKKKISMRNGRGCLWEENGREWLDSQTEIIFDDLMTPESSSSSSYFLLPWRRREKTQSSRGPRSKLYSLPFSYSSLFSLLIPYGISLDQPSHGTLNMAFLPRPPGKREDQQSVLSVYSMNITK